MSIVWGELEMPEYFKTYLVRSPQTPPDKPHRCIFIREEIVVEESGRHLVYLHFQHEGTTDPVRVEQSQLVQCERSYPGA